MGGYASGVVHESLDLFRLLRSVNLQFLQQLAPEQWECFGIHAERGQITIRNLVTYMAGHDANHASKSVESWPEARTPTSAAQFFPLLLRFC
jgi:hypothetical protein